jgi:hypothetical protein
VYRRLNSTGGMSLVQALMVEPANVLDDRELDTARDPN